MATWLEKAREDLIADADEAMKDAYNKVVCANLEEEKAVDQLADIAIKLGKTVALMANTAEKLRAIRLGEYISRCFMWGFVRHLDFDKDYVRYSEAYAKEHEDDEDIRSIINDIIKEIANR